MSYPLLKQVAPGRAADGDRPAVGPTYRAAHAAEGLSHLAGIATCYDLFRSAVEKWPNQPCLAHRQSQGSGYGPYESITYAEVADMVARAASGLFSLGMAPKQRLGIFGVNCVEWMVSLQACNRNNLACVPLYDTLGDEAVQYVISHSEVRVVVVSAAKAPALTKILGAMGSAGAHQTQVASVVVWGPHGEEVLKGLAKVGVKAVTWAQLLEAGAAKPVDPTPPTADDISTIMYTSGTTGNPKGVVHTHRGVAAEVSAMRQYLDHVNLHVGPQDSYLSYLTLAHIYDRVVEELLLTVGGTVGYFCGDMRRVMDDVASFHPTVFCGVPRVLDRVYTGVTDKVNRGSALQRSVFHAALAYKSFWLQRGFSSSWASPLVDRLVFGRTRGALGGRTRLILSGAAPLPQYIMEFLNAAFCCPVMQGYGLTETCAGTFVTYPDAPSQYGTVGLPLPGIDLRLEGVPELSYMPDGSPQRGEICVKGDPLFTSYYRQPELTAESFDDEGFFHTGDIGELTPEGALRVIDRKKNIFKLSQGEYVAVERVENELGKADIVDQLWVYGNSFENNLVAVAVPHKVTLMGWASSQPGLEGLGYEDVCKRKEARTHVTQVLSSTGRAAKLKGFELPAMVYLDPAPFDIERDLVTPKLSLKRPQLLKFYKQQIDAMYAELKAKVTKAAAPAGASTPVRA